MVISTKYELTPFVLRINVVIRSFAEHCTCQVKTSGRQARNTLDRLLPYVYWALNLIALLRYVVIILSYVVTNNTYVVINITVHSYVVTRHKSAKETRDR